MRLAHNPEHDKLVEFGVFEKGTLEQGGVTTNNSINSISPRKRGRKLDR